MALGDPLWDMNKGRVQILNYDAKTKSGARFLKRVSGRVCQLWPQCLKRAIAMPSVPLFNQFYISTTVTSKSMKSRMIFPSCRESEADRCILMLHVLLPLILGHTMARDLFN